MLALVSFEADGAAVPGAPGDAQHGSSSVKAPPAEDSTATPAAINGAASVASQGGGAAVPGAQGGYYAVTVRQCRAHKVGTREARGQVGTAAI